MATYHMEQLCPVIREVGLQRRDSWRTRPRRIYDHEFLYCYMGNANFFINGEKHLLSEGDVVVIPPDTPHSFWVEEEMVGELYYVHCDFEWHDDGDWIYRFYNTPEDYVKLFQPELDNREHIRSPFVLSDGFVLPEYIPCPHNDEIDLIFRSLYKLYTRRDPRFPIQSKTLMLRLIDVLLKACGYYPRNRDRQLQVSEMIIRYIQANYYRKLSVRELCACTHLNADYAGKLFRKETGMSLIDYLNQYRIDKAKRLLLDRDLSIADVAEMVGFQNENYFSSVAKKITGLTPAKLRIHMLSLFEAERPEHKEGE